LSASASTATATLGSLLLLLLLTDLELPAGVEATEAANLRPFQKHCF
jgi:hypothetical protein